MKTIKTNEVVSVQNYPYGFKLKTTLTDYLEFNPSKGYRHCTSTIDPRNGRQNKPKKGTYSALIVRYYNEDNHIKTIHFDFNGDKEINIESVKKHLRNGVKSHKPYGQLPVAASKFIPDDNHGDAARQTDQDNTDHIFGIVVQEDYRQHKHDQRADHPVLQK